MAYNPVRTVVTGSTWSASDWNHFIRDNFAASIPDIFTTKGDIAVATGADAASRLAVGTNDYTLVADDTQTTGVKWGVQPTIDLVTTKGDLLIATAADTLARLGVGVDYAVLKAKSGATEGAAWHSVKAKVKTSGGSGTYEGHDFPTLDTEDFDTANILASSVFTVPETGYYLVSVYFLFNSYDWNDVNDSAKLSIYVNTAVYSIITAFYTQAAAASFAGGLLTGMDIVYATAADEIRIILDETVNVNPMLPNATYPRVMVVRIGV